MTLSREGGGRTNSISEFHVVTDQSRPQSATFRLQQTRPQQIQGNIKKKYHDQECFGQHMLKSTRDTVAARYGTSEYELNINDSLSQALNHSAGNHDQDDCDDDESDDDSAGAAIMAITSAEEYAAKIIKLQQACLIPLKEDLADWLNKILKTSQITISNFMDKLDNGVIICRLAKVISLWCERLFENQENNYINCGSDELQFGEVAPEFDGPRPRTSFYDNNQSNFNSALRSSSSSQSTNCLIKASSSSTSLNNGHHLAYHNNQFLNNLIRMHHTKIWEDARCRTFFARDNVCNFIKWSKDFGVNRSVLFESDDLVLHGNPRQVVLCLLDVARIAYVKYGFTEAPGLVKFEQEIDRELTSERTVHKSDERNALTAFHKTHPNSNSDSTFGVSTSDIQTLPGPKTFSGGRVSIGDATDELVMRYCRHKQEAARKKRQEEQEKLEASAQQQKQQQQQQQPLDSLAESSDSNVAHVKTGDSIGEHLLVSPDEPKMEPDSLVPNFIQDPVENIALTTDLGLSEADGKDFMLDHGRVESLDSGEGPTESASTNHSFGSSNVNPCITSSNEYAVETKIPDLKQSKRDISNSSPIPASHNATNSDSENSELSSSRSSLLSNQGYNNPNSNYRRQITSDLDGKVMRIAKSYYGKKATKDVTRLSEGKYKIADRIVFVRLLKGHRVMVRIGGGWDTLENFLFRHKSDPTQVIDPDNLLPLETKMSLEKSAQNTPKSTPLRSPKIPNYRQNNSASSTNLSLSNLSFSNLSLASSHHNTPSRRIPAARLDASTANSPLDSSCLAGQSPRRQIPCLLIHKGQPVNRLQSSPGRNVGQRASSDQLQQQNSTPASARAQADSTTSQNRSLIKRPQANYMSRTPSQQQLTNKPYRNATKSIHLHRPLASSRAPTMSVTNLYPATLKTNTNGPVA